jgi:hypothetical protein
MTLAEQCCGDKMCKYFTGSEHSITPEIFKLHFAQGCVSTAVDGSWLPLSYFPPGQYPQTWISGSEEYYCQMTFCLH